MKFLFTQIMVFAVSVIFMLYLFSLKFFIPVDAQGVLNWYNIGLMAFLLFLATQALVSLIVFLTQKAIAFGHKEFPPIRTAVRIGLGAGAILLAVFFLNIFHLIDIQWGIALGILLLILVMIMR